MAYKTEIQSLKVSLPSKKHEMTHTADAGAIKLEVHSSGANQDSLFLPSASMSGFLLYHLPGKREESRGESRISYCWVLLLILHTLLLNAGNAVHTAQDRLNIQLK